MPNKIDALYAEVSKTYDVGSIQDFQNYLADPKKRQLFFKDVIAPEYDVKSLDEFEQIYGLKKKESVSPSQQKKQPTSSATGAMEQGGAPASSQRKRYDVKGQPKQPVTPAAPAAQLTAKDLEMMMPFRGEVAETTVVGPAPIAQENPFAQDVKRAGDILTKKTPEGDAFTAGIITSKPETKQYAKEVLAAVEGPQEPSYIEKIVNGSVAAGTLADEIAKIGRNDNIDEIDFEKIASLNKLIQDNAIEDEGGVVGFLKNLPNVLASSLISATAAYESGLAGAGTGAATMSAIPVFGTAAGAAAGYAGATSLALEYSSSLMGALRDAGVDITSEDDLKQAFSNPEKMSEARVYAEKRGVPISVFDMVSGGVAGKLFKTTAKATTKEAIKAGAKEVAVQAALGGAGETTAQLVADGKLDARQIAYEMIAEPVSAIPPAAISYLGEKAKTAAEKKYVKRIETDANLKLKSDIATIVDPEIAASSKKINEYRKLKEEAVSQTAKDEYDKRIAQEREKKYSAYEKFFPVFDSLSEDKKQEAYNALDEVGKVKDEYNAAESPEEKKILGQVLAQKLNKLKEYAVQEQATSEVPVQPETPVGGEVAQGEPQAKPEVVTEEGQAKEEVAPGSKAVISGVEITYPTQQQRTEREAVRNSQDYVSAKSVELPVTDTEALAKDLEGEFAMVTGENPDGQPLTEEENQALNERAQEWLVSRGYDPKPIVGKFNQAENSFFVKGMTEADAIEFAQEFNQKSVAHSGGMLYQDGTRNPRKAGDDFSFGRFEPGMDMVSIVNTTEGPKQFSVAYDFETTLQPEMPAFDQAVNNSAQSLKMVAPDLKVIVAENTEDAQLQIAEALSAVAPSQAADVAEGFTTETRGQTVFVNGKPFAIVLDKSQADSKTVGHEAWEVMLNDAFGDDQAKFKEFRDEIDRQLRLNEFGDIADALTKFSNQRGYEDVKYSEYMAELGGMLVANGFKQGSLDAKQKSLLQKIGDVINKFAQLFTGKKQFLDEATPDDILGFMITISNKVAKGEDVSQFFRGKAQPKAKEGVTSRKQANEAFDGAMKDLGINIGTVNEKTGKAKVTNYDIAAALNKYYEKIHKKFDITDFSDNVVNVVSDYAKNEILFALSRFGTSSGKGWYTEDYAKALDTLSKLDKDIAKKPEIKEVATAIIAVASNSTDVYTNLTRVLYGIDKFKSTRKVPTDVGTGKGASAIASGVERYNNILERFDNDPVKVANFLQKIDSISNLKKKLVDTFGVKSYAQAMADNLATDPEWNDSEVLPMSILIFGPKIGAFYSNLSGLDGTPTIDRWCIRTVYRYRGDMRSKVSEKEMQDFKEANDIIGVSYSDALVLAQEHSKLFNAILTGRGQYKGMPKDERNAALKPYRKGDQIWKKAQGVVNDISEGIEYGVSNKKQYAKDFRSFTKKAFEAARDKVMEESGEKLSVSDVQAILWIYEKNLFGHLGVKQREDSTYSAASKTLSDKVASGLISLDKLKSGDLSILEQADIETDGAMGDVYGSNVEDFKQGIDNAKGRNTSVANESQKSIDEADADFGIEDTKAVLKVRSQKIDNTEVKSVSDKISEKFTVKDINEIKSLINKDVVKPSKTIKAYKLFRVKKGFPGELFPLFVGANESVTVGDWIEAKAGELTSTKEGKTMVKSTLGPLAYRPGWHSGELAIATHIGAKKNPNDKAPTLRAEDQVWAEVEVGADVDWQKEATARAEKTKSGKINLRTAHITDQVPLGGYYKYKTNSNMTGSWIISGEMKVNRVLTDEEVSNINKNGGGKDLPRLKPFDYEAYGFNNDGSVKDPKRVASNQVARAYILSKETGENKELVKAVESKVTTKSQKSVPDVVDEVLTDDGKGNYVFVHYSDEKRDTIKPMSGSKKNFTSREEVAAISSVGGVAMYYTKQGQKEGGVGDVPHTVLVPKDKVYFYGTTERGKVSNDPENFYPEARRRFQEYKNMNNPTRPTEYAFDANNAAAWITKVAAENGYDMVVTNWGPPMSYRAQTVKELTPEAEYTGFKQIPEPKYEVGDEVFLYGQYVTLTDVKPDVLTYETEAGYGKYPLTVMTRDKIIMIQKAKPTVTTKSQKVVVNTIPGYERMMGEVEGILEKTMNSRNGSYNRATAAAIGYIQRSKVYIDADDSQREQIIRDFLKIRGEKFKVAPSVGKILGQIKDVKKVTVNEKTAFKDQIKLEAKAAKDAVAFVKQLRMQISGRLKIMAGRGVISAKQASAILARYDKMNILNPDMRDRFVDYMANVFQSAEYADKVKEATKLRKTIKKAAKNPDNQAENSKMAKSFAEIDPSRVENIDDYINNAEQMLKAVSRKTGDVKMRSLINMTDMVSYIDGEIQAQREQIKNEILSKYQDLVDAGVLDSKMTINEINKVVAAIEENEDESAAKAKEAKEAVKQMMNEVSPILLQIARTGEDPFTGDPIDLTQDEKAAIVKLGKMDLDNLSLAEAVKALEYANNFIANGVTSGIVGMVDLYEGSINTEKLANKGFKSIPIKKYFSPGAGRIWMEQIASLPMVNKLMWGTTSRALEVAEASGVTGVSNGKAKAIKIVEKAVKEYVLRFSKVKDFLSSENVVERGMLAFVSRTVIGDEFQAQDEFNRRKSLIEETIQALKDPENSTDAEIKKGEVVEKVYNKILKNAKNANEVRANVSEINKKAVDWWVNEWSKHYDRMDEVSRNVYNTLLSRDANFTPDRFQLKEVSPAKEEDFDSGFFGNFENVSTEKSGSLKENKRIKNLPQNKNGVKTRIVNLDFDVNNVNALTNAMVDIETAGSVMQMKGFVTSKAFGKLFSNKDDKNVYKKRLVSYVNRVKGQGYVDQSELKALNRLVNTVASFGTAKALFSLSQPFKQSIPPLFNTLIQTGRVDIGTLMNGGFSFIDRTGYPIANRGISSQGELKSINRQLVEAEKNLLLRGVDGVAQYSNLMLELTLKYPDIMTARSSWLSFYKKGLKKEGIKTSDINWNTHEVNKKAADYAQMMVDSQQNISDSDMQGEFMASKDPAKAFLRRAIFPLMTFVLNQKTRIWADIRTLSNKGVATKEDRQEAALSLSGALVELAAFSAISYAANSMLWEIGMNVLDMISGEDDEEDKEEEKKKMILRRSAYTAQNFMKDFFLPPIPGADLIASKGVNYVLDETGLADEIPSSWFGIEDERVKFRLYDKANQGYLDMLGTQGIALEKALELADYYNLAIDGKYTDEKYGGKKQLLEGDVDMARINAAVMTGYYGGLLPADVAYIVGQINKKIRKRAETAEEED